MLAGRDVVPAGGSNPRRGLSNQFRYDRDHGWHSPNPAHNRPQLEVADSPTHCLCQHKPSKPPTHCLS